MAIVKLSNRGVKDISAVGSIGTGDLTFISKQTASSSASISFTSGIDSTYKEYIFFFNNIHPATDAAAFQFQASTDSGSNYNTTMTSTAFRAKHAEADGNTALEYRTGQDVAQGTGYMSFTDGTGTDNDQGVSGYFHVFNPSSTTFVKHFIARFNCYSWNDLTIDHHVAGYFNTTSAIDAFSYKMSSGNIDSGDILLYGVN